MADILADGQSLAIDTEMIDAPLPPGATDATPKKEKKSRDKKEKKEKEGKDKKKRKHSDVNGTVDAMEVDGEKKKKKKKKHADE